MVVRIITAVCCRSGLVSGTNWGKEQPIWDRKSCILKSEPLDDSPTNYHRSAFSCTLHSPEDNAVNLKVRFFHRLWSAFCFWVEWSDSGSKCDANVLSQVKPQVYIKALSHYALPCWHWHCLSIKQPMRSRGIKVNDNVLRSYWLPVGSGNGNGNGNA